MPSNFPPAYIKILLDSIILQVHNVVSLLWPQNLSNLVILILTPLCSLLSSARLPTSCIWVYHTFSFHYWPGTTV